MLNVTRLLIVMSVAILAAHPVMACCLTGHGEPVVSNADVETHPCHSHEADGENATPAATDREKLPEECAGGLICDTAIVQAQTVEAGALTPQLSSEIPYASVAVRFDGFEHKTIVFTTGPPGERPILRNSPITLKQRLLV